MAGGVNRLRDAFFSVMQTFQHGINVFKKATFNDDVEVLGELKAGEFKADEIKLDKPVPVESGGTGKATLIADEILIGDGTNAVKSSDKLTWDSATDTLKANKAELTNALPVGSGGTGKATLIADEILIGDGTNAVKSSDKLTWDSATDTLKANKAELTNALPVGSGGTGNASFANKQIPYSDGTKLTSAATFVYDEGKLGVGTAAPDKPLHIKSEGEQLKLEYSSANHAVFDVDNVGNLEISTSGKSMTIKSAGNEIASASTTVFNVSVTSSAPVHQNWLERLELYKHDPNYICWPEIEDIFYPGVESAFSGSVLLPDGRVFCVPSSYLGKKCIFNPTGGAGGNGAFDEIDDTINNLLGSDQGKFSGGVPLPDGRVFCVPSKYLGKKIIFDPTSGTGGSFVEAGTKPPQTDYCFGGGTLLPDGRVFLAPYHYNGVNYIFNPYTNLFESGNEAPPYGSNKYSGSILLPSGKVFCVPDRYRLEPTDTWNDYLIFDPASGVFEQVAQKHPIYYHNGARGSLLPDGRVFIAIRTNNNNKNHIYNPPPTHAGKATDYCWHPFFNYA